jgi:hypothetical protein
MHCIQNWPGVGAGQRRTGKASFKLSDDDSMTWEDDMNTRASFIGLLLFLVCSICAVVRW